MGNWEMDVAIEDETVAATLGEHFLADLARSTEIVLENLRSAKAPPGAPAAQPTHGHAQRRASRKMLRSVTGVGRSVGAVVTGNRSLESFEATPITVAAAVLLAFAAVSFAFPRLLAFPIAGLAAWVGLTFLVEAWVVWRRR
jgi:cardiolipin synthase